MKIAFWYIGKSTPQFVVDGIAEYQKRIKHYIPFEIQEFQHVKNAAKLPPAILKQKEADMIVKKLQKSDKLFVLDEHGKEYRSIDFANKLEQWNNQYNSRMIFLVGGAFGIDDVLKKLSVGKISLGKATYSHQVIRIMFCEQLYRACTILKGEKYHNE